MGADISEKATEAIPSGRSSSHGGDSTDVPTPGAKDKGAAHSLAALEKADTHVTTAQKPEDNDPYKNLCTCFHLLVSCVVRLPTTDQTR